MQGGNNWVVVVPARLESQRFPRKALADLCGKPLVVRAYENLLPLRRSLGADIYVACDSEEFAQALRAYDVSVIITSSLHASGTDRSWEAVESLKANYVLNVQADEPFLCCEELFSMCQALEERPWAHITTLVAPIDWQPEVASNPHRVKAVLSHSSRVLYFSRSPVPYSGSSSPVSFFEHQGCYAYRRHDLRAFTQLPPSSLEKAEGLEQLRALENDWTIYAHKAQRAVPSINVPDDLVGARKIFSSKDSSPPLRGS